MRSVELFAGAGGLAIGMAKAGFHHAAVIEWNADACETFRENQRHRTHLVDQWPLHEGDVRGFDYSALTGDVMVVSGGPPCQPFSMGGKHRGHLDERDMFPEAVRAVRELRPKAFIFENVKGLKRETFATYFEYIRLQLMYPDLRRRAGDAWREHCHRLEKHHTANHGGAEYNVVAEVLNAAALQRLKKPDCSNLYGGQGANIMASTQYEVAPIGGPGVGADTVVPGAGGIVRLNSNGPMYDYSANSKYFSYFKGGFRGGSAVGSVFLLHELGHQLGDVTHFFSPDAGAKNAARNAANTDRVLKNCF